MMSIAEYAALWPQAGGQQFFTQMVAPRKMKRFLSYVVGWCVLIGEISTSSSGALNSAQIVAAFVGITHPETTWRVGTNRRVVHVSLMILAALDDFHHLQHLPCWTYRHESRTSGYPTPLTVGWRVQLRRHDSLDHRLLDAGSPKQRGFRLHGFHQPDWVVFQWLGAHP